MGLFNSGVNQVEHDRLKQDFNILKFTNNLEEFKSSHAIIFSDMKFSLGKACGGIDAICALVDAQLISTAKSLFEVLEGEIVENINKANQSHRTIVESMNAFTPEVSRAYIAHLHQTAHGATPFHEQVNNINDLLGHACKMLRSIQDTLA